MPTYRDDPARRLNDLLDLEEPRIANIFRVAIQSLKDEVDLNELADLLEAGREHEALERLAYAAERLGSASNATFIRSGQSTARFLEGAGVGRIVFDEINIAAVAAMQANRLELIREFTSEQRRATQRAILTGVEAGINPIAQARNFRDSIGLTTAQWDTVAAYRRQLEAVGRDDQLARRALEGATRDKRGDSQILRAIRLSRSLPKEKIDWLVERRTAKLIAYRSRVIARTEALRAVHEGNEESYRQAIEAGHIRAEQLERTWRTRLDNRERETHHLLNGVKRRWGEAWVTRNGPLRYPGDPLAPAAEVIQCRCAIMTRITVL